jgi:hypothetical protein
MHMHDVIITPAKARKLKRARKSRSISIDVATKTFKMPVSRLEAIELGEKNYNLTLLVKMCDYMVDVLDVVT